MKNNTTYIDEAEVYQCNFCGAHAETADKIEHYPTCTRAQGPEQYDGMFEE